MKTTTTLTPEASRRSESLTLALVGTGFVVLLAGFFYGRIKSLGFMGSTITLSDLNDSARAMKEITDHVNKALAAQEEAFKVGFAELAKRIKALEDEGG